MRPCGRTPCELLDLLVAGSLQSAHLAGNDLKQICKDCCAV